MTRTSLILVEDDAPLRNLLRHILRDVDGLEIVAEAANGKIAVDECHRLQPDLVLLDIVMPVMDGFEALPLIRRASPRSRVIVLTMLAEGEMGDKCRALGAHDVLSKALPNDELVAYLRRAARAPNPDGGRPH